MSLCLLKLLLMKSFKLPHLHCRRKWVWGLPAWISETEKSISKAIVMEEVHPLCMHIVIFIIFYLALEVNRKEVGWLQCSSLKGTETLHQKKPHDNKLEVQATTKHVLPKLYSTEVSFWPTNTVEKQGAPFQKPLPSYHKHICTGPCRPIKKHL